MNKDEFIKQIEKLNIYYNNDMLEKLDIYSEFLIEYNKHTNVTRILDRNDIYLKHFYDSLTITKVIDLNKINNLLDVGSGAGFPGVVLKIFFPNIKVTLIDSNNKKIKFLKELIKKLNLDIEIICDRVEEYAINNLNKYDLVTSRAVANLRVLSELSLPLVNEKGLFISLKGNMDDSYENAINTINNLDSKIINQETFNLYDNNYIRNIIVIKKYKKTNKDILRTYDKIVKTELKNHNK